MNRDTTWVRQRGVLWRVVGADVILRRTHERGADAEAQLAGAAAVVWMDLDSPRTAAELEEGLTEAGADGVSELVTDALAVLANAGLIEVRKP